MDARTKRNDKSNDDTPEACGVLDDLSRSTSSYSACFEEPHEAEGDAHGGPAAGHHPRAGPRDGGAAQHGTDAAERGERGGGQRDDDADAEPVVADEACGQQRHERADGEGERGRDGGLDGARERLLLLAAALAVAIELSQLDVALGADGDELADGHAAGARQEAREAGDDHGARVRLHGAHAQHQRRRRHQPVVGAQHGGAQPVGALRQDVVLVNAAAREGTRVLGVHNAGQLVGAVHVIDQGRHGYAADDLSE
uniref:Uncharacterized protein n=1 Tax=Setaria italica TaxID=4555 RepID=K3Z911_SETIT